LQGISAAIAMIAAETINCIVPAAVLSAAAAIHL
jgi:hypothetical protein